MLDVINNIAAQNRFGNTRANSTANIRTDFMAIFQIFIFQNIAAVRLNKDQVSIFAGAIRPLCFRPKYRRRWSPLICQTSATTYRVLHRFIKHDVHAVLQSGNSAPCLHDIACFHFRRAWRVVGYQAVDFAVKQFSHIPFWFSWSRIGGEHFARVPISSN